MKEFDIFPFEEEDFNNGGTVTIQKLPSYDVVGNPGVVYVPYTFETKIDTIEESDMLEYFHKRLRYKSKIPMDRFETIKISNEETPFRSQSGKKLIVNVGETNLKFK